MKFSIFTPNKISQLEHLLGKKCLLINRPSGTEDVTRVYVEGEKDEIIKEITDKIAAKLVANPDLNND